jgi:hypothetical protein
MPSDLVDTVEHLKRCIESCNKFVQLLLQFEVIDEKITTDRFPEENEQIVKGARGILIEAIEMQKAKLAGVSIFDNTPSDHF